jgi:hypothetical protein
MGKPWATFPMGRTLAELNTEPFKPAPLSSALLMASISAHFP